MKKRLMSMLLVLVFVLGMLPGTVLAVDYAAQIGDVNYETIEEAFAAANAAAEAAPEANSPIRIVLLKDTAVAAGAAEDLVLNKGLYKLEMGSFTLDLREIGLVVAEEGDLIITGGAIVSAGESYALKNSGQLLLENVTVTAEHAAHALVNSGEHASAAVQSGSIAGKEYGVRLESGTVVLAVTPVSSEGAPDESEVPPVEGEEPKPVNNDPKITGEKASFAIDKGVIHVSAALHEETAYTVDKTTPGMFVQTEAEIGLRAEAFRSVNEGVAVAAGENGLLMESNITDLFAITDTEFTYNGQKQVPTVTVADENLKQGENYVITYRQGDSKVDKPVNAGEYVVSIQGLNGYVVEKEAAFIIKQAVPTIIWAEESESLVYSGKAAAPSVKANVTLGEGESFNGELTYSHRTGGGSYVDGLPADAGTYEIKAAIAANGNYAAAETAAPLQLTISKLTVNNPVVELTAPQNGYVYTGAEITPKVTVKDGTAEIPPSFYSVAYSNNVEVGTAKVTIAPANANIVLNGELTKDFTIEKADQAVLNITGVPAAVTYGDAAFTLSTSGGNTDSAVAWSIAEGKEIASVTADGVVTISGAGKVTVRAAKSGNESFNLATGEVSFTVAPKTLSVSGATVANKTYDGKKTVSVTEVALSGVVGSDDVKVDVSGLQGELAQANAGAYDKVTLPALTLSGSAAAKYTLSQPTEPVAAAAKILKAELPKALTEITKNVATGAEEAVVESLGAEMPADAGKLTYTNGNQSIGDGDGVVVMKRDVSENGVLSLGFVNAKAGDKIICEVIIGSENYVDAKLVVTVAVDTMKLDDKNCTVALDNSAYTYDGKEHKPKVTVKVGDDSLKEGTDFDVKYPDDTKSVGEKTLEVTFKGDFTGSATAKYAVNKAKLTVSGTKASNKTYDGNTNATVTAGSLRGVVSGDTVTVTAKGSFADKNSGNGKTVNVTYTLGGANAGNYELQSGTDTVKANISAHTPYYYSNLLAKMSESNVDSGDKSTLQSIVNDINMILTDANLASSHRTTFTDIQMKAEGYINRIESAAAAIATASVQSAGKVTADTVQLTDQSTLTKAQSDLNAAITTYKGNYTTVEQSKVDAQLQQVNQALAVLERVKAVENKIDGLSDNASAEAVADARAAYDALSDYEKTLVTTMALNQLEAAEGNPLTTTQTSPQVTPGTKEPEQNKDTVEFPFGAIIIVAVVACGGVAAWFVVRKMKEEEEANW